MPSRFKDPKAYLLDIRDNILLARGFVEGQDYGQFLVDRRSVYAVTRALEVISEPSRRLPKALKARHTSIPFKRPFSASRLRHA